MSTQLLKLAILLSLGMTLVMAVSESWYAYHARTQAIANARKRVKRAAQFADSDTLHSRQKRTIAFPTGSSLILSPVFCIPLISNDDFSKGLYIELPLSIKLPNSTQIAALGRNADRLGLYSAVEDALARFGLDGKACLQRAVCEVSHSPLKHNGLLGEALNILLGSPGLDESDPYGKAQYYGRSHGDCPTVYPECPMSVLKLLD